MSDTLQANGYPQKLIDNIKKRLSNKKPKTTPPPETLLREFFELVDPAPKSFAVLPYIRGITEPITRILGKHDVKVSNKPIKTLMQEFPSLKDRPDPEKETNVVY